MVNCRYVKNKIECGIEHFYCTNEELKKLNKSNGKDIPCIKNTGGLNCGKFEEKNNPETAE